MAWEKSGFRKMLGIETWFICSLFLDYLAIIRQLVTDLLSGKFGCNPLTW